MNGRHLSCVGVVVVCAGCALPRSMVVGQTAAGLGPGQAEAAASIGPQYTSVLPPSGSTASSETLLSFPVVEANFLYGFSDTTSASLHLSPAGIQPGVKFTVLNGPVQLALLPELGGGVFYVNAGGTNGSETEFAFLAGAKVLISTPGGFYAGVGYDFTYLSLNLNASSLLTGGTGTGTTGGTSATPTPNLTATSHSGMLAVGYEFRSGALRIRPELSLLYTPGYQSNGSQAGAQIVVMPSVTLAVASRGSAGSASGSDSGGDDSAHERPSSGSPFKF